MPPKLIGTNETRKKVGFVVKTQNPSDQPQVLEDSTFQKIRDNLKKLGPTPARSVTTGLPSISNRNVKPSSLSNLPTKTNITTGGYNQGQGGLGGQGGQKTKFTEAFQRNIEQQRQEMVVAAPSHFTFGMVSSEMAGAMGVIKLTNSSEEGELTVRDGRLGPRNNSSLCETCHQNMKDCTGHHAYIDIPFIVHPNGAALAAHILTCTCPNCGGSLITHQQIIAEGIEPLRGSKRLIAIRDLVKKNNMGCHRECASPMASCKDNPEPVRVYMTPNEDNYLLHYHYVNEATKKYDMTPAEAYEILARISPEDVTNIFGFTDGAHPKNYIPNRLLVPPYAIRPDVRLADRSSLDYISNIYQKIIKHSNEYFQLKNEDDKVMHINAILKLVYALIKGDKTKQGSRGGRESSVATRMNKKEGYMRAKSEGRTVNFTARAVAAPGYNLRLDEAGIPLHISKKITIETKVTSFNKTKLQALYNAGNVANIIQVNDTKGQGIKKTITDTFRAKHPDLLLHVGDTVWRSLMDGDVVILNRQPTLHRYGMMAFHVKIIPEDVVRVPYEVATAYNLDFDGDEVNMHFPQTVEAMNEAMMLAGVGNNLMAVSSGRPIIIMIQDSVLTSYLLTRDPVLAKLKYNFSIETKAKEYDIKKQKMEITANNELDVRDRIELLDGKDRELASYIKKRAEEIGFIIKEYEDNKKEYVDMDPVQFNESLDAIGDQPQIESLRQRCEQQGIVWGSRKCLFSAALPVRYNDDNKLVGFVYQDKGLNIINSVLISGTVTKKHVGSSDSNMLTELLRQFDGQTYVDFLSDFRFMANIFLRSVGFSTSLYDALPDDYETLSQYISQTVQEATTKVLALSAPAKTEVERYQNELKIREVLNVTKRIADVRIPETFPPQNPYSLMIEAGSKGSWLNLAQMTALLGQQAISDERPARVLPGGRTLPVFSVNDRRPETQGFVKNSFFTGLTATEYMFHTMAVRENLADTSVNTRVTGHNQRQSVKGNEDFVINTLGAVKNANDKIVQAVYGDSGFATNEVMLATGGRYTPRRFQNIAAILNAQA